MDKISFEQMLHDVRSCDYCLNHLPHGARPVVQLNPKANILIAGQAPGLKVHQSGIPFNDPSGDRLRSWMGIDKATFYDATKIAILPMGFCYPGTGKSGDLPPRPECAVQWRKPILSRMPNIALTLVIGQYAMAWHLPETKRETLTHTVKSWQTCWPATLPLPHPSPRNNIWLKNNPWFEDEILPILRSKIKTLI